MTSITPISVGPGTNDLPPLVNNVKDWDAVLRLRTAMTKPGLSLSDKVQLAANPGLKMPQGTARPDPASSAADQENALKLFNAVVDALVSLTNRAKFDFATQPKDMQVLDIFFMPVPQPGYTVKLVVNNKLEQIPVYQRV